MADQGIVNDLMKMTESYLELPTDHMYDIMLDSFKKCEKGAFFFDKDPRQTTKYAYTDVTEKVHHIATATICNNMSQVDDWDFDNCVYSDNSDMISDYFGLEFAQLLLAEQCKQTYTCMNTALQAKEAYSKALEELYVQKEFIISTIAEQIILKNVNPASMKLFVLKMLESKKIDDIIKRWKDVLGPDLEKQVDLAEGYVHGSEIVEVCRNRLKTDKQCFKTEITRKCNVFDIIYDPPYPPMEGPWIQSTVYLYGQDVVKWLKSKAKDYGLFTGNYPDNVDFANPFGCFIGGTDVLMKDTSSKAIESLTVGDKIACAKGKVGVISTERVQHKHDTRYRVYGFNDEEPFFLGVHPFWTQHGWKSMFPVQSKGENPSLHCGQLEVGDFVLRAVSESSNLKYKWVEVKKIHYQSVSSKEKVYGVHTVSGSKSYHANGYVVCENYPQITLARLQQGVASLDQEGKDEILKLRPALVKIFGDGMSDVIMKSLKETKLNRGKPEKKITSLLGDRSFEMKFVSNSNDEFKPVPQHMSYHQGELFIDGNHISNAEVYQNKKIVWSKRDDGGRWYHGVFTIRNNGVTGKCILIKSKDFNCKQIISSTELEVKMVRNDYVMKKSVEEIPKDEDEDKDGRKKMKKSTKNEEFIDFGTMCIAIHKDEVSNEDIVEAGIQYPGMNNEEFFGSPVGYDTDTLKFHVEITIDKDMFSDPDGFDRDYDRYISFEGYVDMMGQKVDGVCYVYDPACPDNEGAKYKWDGELTHSDMFLRNADKAKKMACLRYIHTDPDEDFHHMQLNKKDDVNSPSKKYVSHGALQYTEAYYDGELSTQNLEYANFPDSDAANSILMDLVSMCVTHDIDGDLRTNILGTADPDFIGFSEVKKIAEDEKFKDTFGQKFGIAYLLQGLLQSDESKNFFTEDDKQRLVSYWKGTTTNCLSQDKDYAEAQRLLNRLVHIENTTIDDNQSLQDYLDDGGEKWAKNLYEAISTYDSITSMAMADSITKGNGPYHKYVMLLFCLAPDKEYCDLLHSDILTYRLQELHEYFDGTEEEIVDKEIKDVVKEFMSKF
ncbi:uncharacterized protein [Clytia hemisphaerica]|uniref:Uncharacterized protein n=1 Tax=Clytia hemisphaerica TaxID=252671 RepID=A0A7M6DN20_9CNID